MNLNNMQLVNLPKTREGQVFEKMIKAGIEPLKIIIEHERLAEEVTENDIELLIHAIGQGLSLWVTYLKKVNQSKAQGGDK